MLHVTWSAPRFKRLIKQNNNNNKTKNNNNFSLPYHNATNRGFLIADIGRLLSFNIA